MSAVAIPARSESSTRSGALAPWTTPRCLSANLIPIRPSRSRLWALCTLVLCLACRDAGHAPSRAEAPIPSGLPLLERVIIPGLDTVGPERTSAIAAFSPAGRLVFTDAFDADGRLFTIVDTTGAVLARFGRKGKGPGEFVPRGCSRSMTRPSSAST